MTALLNSSAISQPSLSLPERPPVGRPVMMGIMLTLFGFGGLTAWSALVTHGRILPGDWVLAIGTGGVGLVTLQIATAMGATPRPACSLSTQ